jgi:hypothetical protein
MTLASAVRRSDKARVVRLRKGRLTGVTAQEASLATLGAIGGDRAHVALLPSVIMNALEIGARLAPIFGFPHRSILRGV